MRTVNISALTFDVSGYLSVTPSSPPDLGDTSRRVNKQLTLDGGVVIADGGHSYGDRNIRLNWRTRDSSYEDVAKNIVRNHAQVYVSTEDGCFLAVPERYSHGQGNSTLSLLVKEKSSQ